MELFSEAWAEAWGRSINDDPDYREAGQNWEGPVILRRADQDGAGVFADLSGGVCGEARGAAPADDERARIVIEAPDVTWRRVLAGDVDPILGLVSGKLTLAKGSLLTLMPHKRSAEALLAAAKRVEATPPSDPATARGDVSSDDGAAPLTPKPAGSRPPAPFRTTSGGGLDPDLFPMRLYHKAKRLGVWDPAAVDLTRDAEDWKRLASDEQDLLLRLSTLFQAGEEAVARDLLPLIQVVSNEGRLEEDMYLTTFLFEEAKHVETFWRFFTEVAPDHGDLTRFETPSYRAIFVDELPAALHGLADDASPRAQARAAVAYNMIVEGVLAETGYRAYHATLEARGILPGMQELVRLVKRDESRHIAYGLYLLSRLVREHGEELWRTVESELARLVDPALAVVQEAFDAYEVMPFGLMLEDFTAYALQQFQSRVRRLETARVSGGLIEMEG
jgi:ribonucleoside-diphosphate reductase beta chain